ncbi:hypothetical protein SLA2020_236730 [Shorea laevis]
MINWRTRRALSSLSRTPPKLSSLELNNLLRHCSNSKSLNQGKQVHPQIIVHGFHQNFFVITKLIQMYADCDDLASAHKLFDQVQQPNVFAWTAVLAFYSRHGLYEECVGGYYKLRSLGVLPDGYVFPKVLRACGQLLCLESGMLVHKDVIVCGCELNLEVSNSLIDMYARCWDVKAARQVFDEMLERHLLSWNLMISGYVGNGLLEMAVAFLYYMRLDGFEPDTVTWNMIMDAYCLMGRCDEAWEIFEENREPNIVSWTTLISGYSRIGEHEKSLWIFKDMLNRSMLLPDLGCLSSALASCRHLGALTSGKEIHGYGIKIITGHAFYSSAGAALLTMYSKCGRSQEARNVFELMDKSDVVTWNAMILCFVDLGLGHLALECLGKMQRLGIRNDQTTLSTVLPVCDFKSGQPVHSYVIKCGFDSVVLVCNALIHMYSKCGHIESSYSIFTIMVNRDLISWNTMIGGFAMHGIGQVALQLLPKMVSSGLCPNSLTFTSALSACNHSGLVEEGLKLFHSISNDFGLAPRMEHYACVVDMLARAGRLEDALNFIHEMPLEPNKRIWGALLAACQECQNVNIGKVAAEHLICLEPEHAGHYITLSNIYARVGRWDDAVRVRKQMEGRGLTKQSGESWIERGS